MTISRRKFLKLLITAIGGSLAGYGAFRYLSAQFPDRIWALNSWLTEPTLADAPTGSLSEETLQILMTTVLTLLDASIEVAHYESFFRWRAENLSGYLTLYEDFAMTLNQTAEKLNGCDFEHCEPNVRYGILAKAFEVREASSRIDEIRLSIFERDWLRFDQYIIREIFALFARTDALIALGYEAWPGMPRGLDGYTGLPSEVDIGEVK